MKFRTINKKVLRLLAVLVPLFLLFVYVALQSGPLAPVPVTVTVVEKKQISPVLFGIGSLEARYTYRIGAVASGRIRTLNVEGGDVVHAGQVLGEIDPVDLDEHLSAQLSGIKRSEATIKTTEALLHEARAKNEFANNKFADRSKQNICW